MTGQSFRNGRSLRPAVWMILITALLDMMAMGIVTPVLPGLIEGFTGSVGKAAVWTGIVASLWAVMQFLCAPVIGGLADRYGRRPVILISSAGLALDWVLMALAPNLWWLVVGRIIGGITSASGTALFAYMADITPPERRARAFGLLGAAISAGFVAGPAVGGILGEWSPRLPFWTAAGLSFAAFLYGLLVLPESLPRERRTSFTWRSANPAAALALLGSDRALSGLAAASFLLSFTHRLFMTVFVLFAAQRHGLGVLEAGVIMAGLSALDLLMQGVLVGPVTARFGDRATMIFGLLAAAIGLLAAGFAPSAGWFVAALILTAPWGLSEPTIKSLMSRQVSESEQGRVQGAAQSVLSLAGIAGPLFFGWVYGASSLTMPWLSFLVASALLLLAALAGGLMTPRARPNASVAAVD